jgi:hypothetical protein
MGKKRIMRLVLGKQATEPVVDEWDEFDAQSKPKDAKDEKPKESK